MEFIVSHEQRGNEAGWTRRFAVVLNRPLNIVGPLARATRPCGATRLVSDLFKTIKGCSLP